MKKVLKEVFLFLKPSFYFMELNLTFILVDERGPPLDQTRFQRIKFQSVMLTDMMLSYVTFMQSTYNFLLENAICPDYQLVGGTQDKNQRKRGFSSSYYIDFLIFYMPHDKKKSVRQFGTL